VAQSTCSRYSEVLVEVPQPRRCADSCRGMYGATCLSWRLKIGNGVPFPFGSEGQKTETSSWSLCPLRVVRPLTVSFVVDKVMSALAADLAVAAEDEYTVSATVAFMHVETSDASTSSTIECSGTGRFHLT